MLAFVLQEPLVQMKKILRAVGASFVLRCEIVSDQSEARGYSFLTLNWIRRFFRRFASVSFGAPGRVSPYPAEWMRAVRRQII